ncbi:hypothetical protein Q8A67_012163 [Cirrhinus molitorella]|uniref:Uncharacterized protein n=1 Tax=Cirrhinus molitorella TaxID=172907 RepID=A0AA88TMI8_9TELE|nr:hypothetical protein Q8A67_012163 [Cirrhinus molitorella]
MRLSLSLTRAHSSCPPSAARHRLTSPKEHQFNCSFPSESASGSTVSNQSDGQTVLIIILHSTGLWENSSSRDHKYHRIKH